MSDSTSTMNKQDLSQKYETVIGLEIHVQLKTNSKIFCGDKVAFGSPANTHISTISLAHPGILPRINKKVIAYAVKLGLAMNCKINLENRFDRKNYFYPDLPKGFQTTQDALPICVGGYLDVKVNGTPKRIGLTRIHIEEDAGKLIHDLDDTYSLVDLNRAGTPLLEIVSEPDMRSSDEVMAYITKIRQLVRFLDVCDGNMEEGSMRCDCNVSVRLRGAEKFGNRCEVKNVNSIRNAKRAIDFEVQRQIQILENGGFVDQQTRSFDATDGTTFALRDKENAHDYRYFPEPDLPPVILTQGYVDAIKAAMPTLPDVLFEQFVKKYDLSEYDANILTDDRDTANYYLEILKHTKNYKAAANWMINSVKAFLNENGSTILDFQLSPKSIAALIQLIDSEKVSNSIARKQLFPAMLQQPKESPETLAEKLNLIQNQDADFLVDLAKATLAKHQKQVEAYRNAANSGKGKKLKKKLISMFMGDVMRNSKGKADPKKTTAILIQLLEK